MINNRLKLAIPLSALLLLSSCRTEEFLQEIEQKEEISKKFITFTKKHENDVIDYGEGFKYLALRYDSIHKTNITGNANIEAFKKKLQSNKKEMPLSEREKISYIDFNIRSQLIEEENGDKWMIFPEVKGKKVVNLVAAVLSKEETLLGYHYINKETNFYKENIGLFQERYNKRFLGGKDPLLATVRRWYKDGDYVSIDEVIISIKQGNSERINGDWNMMYLPTHSGGGGGGFDCNFYGACLSDIMGSGGNGFFYPDPPPTPCDKIKSQTADKTYIEKKEHLQNQTDNDYEVGFRVGLPVSYAGQTGIQYQVLSNKPGTSELEFRIFNTTFGIMHTHYDGLYPMFSPGDIYLFGQLLTNAQNHNIPLSDVFLSVVTPAGNYQLRFEGTHFAGWNQNFDFNQLNKDYVKREYLGEYDKGTQEKFEQGFLKFMKDKMNIEGAKLIREGESGNTQLNLDHRGNLKTDDCK